MLGFLSMGEGERGKVRYFMKLLIIYKKKTIRIIIIKCADKKQKIYTHSVVNSRYRFVFLIIERVKNKKKKNVRAFVQQLRSHIYGER